VRDPQQAAQIPQSHPAQTFRFRSERKYPSVHLLLPKKVCQLSMSISTMNATDLINNSEFIGSLECSIKYGAENISCTESCGTVNHIFNDWPNFYTCSWYPELSNALDHSNLDGPNLESLARLGISGNQREFSNNISVTIANCLSDFCRSSSTDCPRLDHSNSCALENLITVNGSSGTLSANSAITCLQDGVCGSDLDVNPDIGGMGVSHTRYLLNFCPLTVSGYDIAFNTVQHFSA
jgi:hypothetical protein